MFGTLTSKLFGNSVSKQAAKNRLQMVLVQDRSGLTKKDMEKFRKELMGVFSKYFELESKKIDIEWKRDDNSTALIVNTPISRKALSQ